MSTLAVGTIKSISSAAPIFQNTSGVEQGKLIKAYALFSMAGTASLTHTFNVSSLTDNGTGDSTLTFTNNLSNSEYLVIGCSETGTNHSFTGGSMKTRTVSACRVIWGVSGGENSIGFVSDLGHCSFIVLRD